VETRNAGAQKLWRVLSICVPQGKLCESSKLHLTECRHREGGGGEGGEVTLKSYTMCSRMSLSATNPSARNTITMGISVRMYGSVHRMHLNVTQRASS
jgi:hypothetical protein